MIEVTQRPDHSYVTPEGRILPGITSILRAGGGLYELEANGFLDPSRGDRVHQAVHFDCEGDLDETTVLPEEFGFVEAARRARREMGIEIKHAEWAVGNPTLGFATKIDCYALWEGRPTSINWKTGVKVYRCEAIQSALEALIFSPEPVRRLMIHLRADGTYRPEEYKKRSDFEVAKAFLTARAWQKGDIA